MKESIEKMVALGMLVASTAEITTDVSNKAALIVGASSTPALADEEYKALGSAHRGINLAVHGVPTADQLEDGVFLAMVNNLYINFSQVEGSTGARRTYMKKWLETATSVVEEVQEEKTPKVTKPETLADGELEDAPPVPTAPYFEPGRYEGISNDDYHSANGVSSTQVKDARISLMYFNGRHVAKTIKKESTEALTFGSLVHAMVLEPEKLEEEFSIEPVIPDGAFTNTESIKAFIDQYNAPLPQPIGLGTALEDTKAFYESLPTEWQTIPVDGKLTAAAMKDCIKQYNVSLPPLLKASGKKEDLAAAIKAVKPDAVFADEILEAWQQSGNGKILIPRRLYELATNIQQAVFNHPFAGGLVSNPNRSVEVSYFGLDDDTGLDIRVRPDMEIDFDGIRVGFDLKTVQLGRIKQDALRAKLHRTIIDMDYHVSAAMYCDVADLSQFFWIFVNKDEGYHWIAIVEASEDELELGRLEYKKALRDIQNAHDTGIWPAPITSELVDELNDFELRRLEALRFA
jgi:exodeoxyribonuclease VIII